MGAIWTFDGRDVRDRHRLRRRRLAAVVIANRHLHRVDVRGRSGRVVVEILVRRRERPIAGGNRASFHRRAIAPIDLDRVAVERARGRRTSTSASRRRSR